jgi:WD40 repeat protein/serine/threonine protein kinase
MSEREIFFEALDLDDPAERAAYVDGACAGDAALRQRIETLLRLHANAGDFLDTPAAQQLAAKGDTPAERPGAGVPLDFLAPPARAGSLGRLGHYEVLEVVGKGGMGVVLRAFDEKLQRVVAIKALLPALASTGSARQRFVREAQAAAAVTHDHVIDIHAVEDAGAVPYLVMQFIDGVTLQDKLDRSGPLSLKEVLRIGLQVASGLAAAHAQGLVHRDVKPANILLENGIERVKITDFGLARTMDDASLTQSGLIAGTPAYMSPEQAEGAKIDHRSDLFSLGSLLYTLCAGHAPFRAETTMAVLRRVCEDTPRPLREVNPDIPDWLAAIIAKLHAKSPEERYQSAAEVAELFGRHLAHLQQPGMGEPTAQSERAVPKPQARRPRAQWVAAVLLLAVAVLGVSAALYWALRQRDETKKPEAPNGAAKEAPPWKPRPPLTPEELAKLPSPLDALKREAMGVPQHAPAELVAVLGGFPRFVLPERTEGSHWMAQSSDGRLLAVPCGLNILLFEARTGTLLRTLTGHTANAYRPAFSPDGKRLASGSVNCILRVWDVASGREELTLTGHTSDVWSVAWGPEGKRLVSADGAGTVKVWDAQGKLLTSFQGHDKGIAQLAFSPDGKRLATPSLDGFCKIWDTDNWQQLHSLPANGKAFAAVAWSRDGKLLAAGDDEQVIVWDAKSYEKPHTLTTPGTGLLAFSPDGTALFTARCDCTRGERNAFTRWDVTTWKAIASCALPTRLRNVFFYLSQDGRTVFVTMGLPVELRVREYDAETGQERFPLSGQREGVLAVAVSPDGRTLASGSVDHTVRLWDLAAWRPGEPLPPFRVLQGHTSRVWSVAFSPDGKLLASGSSDGTILLWDVVTGDKVHVLTGHSQSELGACLTFSPDGRTVLAGGQDRTVNRWDALTAQQKEPWHWHQGAVRAVACSPDGQLVASGGQDGTVGLLDAATGQRVHAFPASGFITDLAFSPDGRTLAAVNAAPGPTLRLWDLETKTERSLTGHTGHILGVSFHPEGKMVCTASVDDPFLEDGTVRLWDTRPSGKAVRALDFRWAGGAPCAAFTPEGRHLVVGLGNGTIALLRVGALPPQYVPAPAAKLPAAAELAKRPAAADALKREDIPAELLEKAGGGDKDKALAELVAIFGEDRHARGEPGCHLYAVAFSPNGKTLAFGGVDKVVRLIDLATGKQRQELTTRPRSAEDPVYTLAFSPDGKVLACGMHQGSILLWDVATGGELRGLGVPEPRLYQVAFSPDGTLLAAALGGSVGALRVWNVATGNLVFTSRMAGASAAWSVAFSPDGKTLAAGLESGDVHLFDVASGGQFATLSGHGGRVRWLGFHPDGRSLVVAGPLPENTVFVWDLTTRKQPRRLLGHGSEVLTGAWRADGRLLITAGSMDGTVRLWDLSGDVPRSKALAVIPPNVRWLTSIALSSEGRHLAVCHPNGTVHVLRLAKVGEVYQVPE